MGSCWQVDWECHFTPLTLVLILCSFENCTQLINCQKKHFLANSILVLYSSIFYSIIIYSVSVREAKPEAIVTLGGGGGC